MRVGWLVVASIIAIIFVTRAWLKERGAMDRHLQEGYGPPDLPDGWQISESGNPTFLGQNSQRKRIRATVFADQGRRTFWKFVVTRVNLNDEDMDRHDPFYSNHYYSQSDALNECQRFILGLPLTATTYQKDRDAERLLKVPSLLMKERERQNELVAKVDRGRAKPVNLRSEAEQRLKAAEHLHSYIASLGCSASQTAEADHLIATYREMLARIREI
ncbi:hypothetical protein CDV52_09915 [Haematobacter missouriensis]|uniref:Uncharacterized protein n=1 Tax=Haematobacter missouriensis TaxID=366616 RepID=A0A212AR57_9RHOB|nr:hypothetical protein CDV52_09915 [Haematobacter missouriensis]